MSARTMLGIISRRAIKELGQGIEPAVRLVDMRHVPGVFKDDRSGIGQPGCCPNSQARREGHIVRAMQEQERNPQRTEHSL